jgi:thiosulfate/3-mercaptopyruvate sulfurtransferase
MTDQKPWPIFIEPDDLHARLSNQPSTNEAQTHQPLLIWDLTSETSYQEKHLKDAVFVPFAEIRSGEPPIQGLLPSKDQLTALFSRLGLTDDAHVILYDDDGGGKSGRMAWTLDVIGHHHYSILNGGLAAWEAATYPVSTEPTEPTACDFKVTYLTEDLIVTKDWLIKDLNNPQLIIWDARSPQEYEGSLVRATKAGHIPGAVNYEWTQAMRLDEHRKLRPLDEIRKELAKIGITTDKTIVTHCQTHHRSGFTYALGKALGFKDIRAYPGSWSEWGNDPDTPVSRS